MTQPDGLEQIRVDVPGAHPAERCVAPQITKPDIHVAVLQVQRPIQRADPGVRKGPGPHSVIHMAVSNERLDREIGQRADYFVQAAITHTGIQQGGLPVPPHQVHMGARRIGDAGDPAV